MFHPQGPSFVELAFQAMSSTRGGYDLLAPKFEYTPFRTPDDVLAPVVDQLRQGPPVGRALDVCCGTGVGMVALRPLADEVVGIDFSQPMLDVAARHLELSRGGAAWQLTQGDVMEMAYSDEFDLAVCFGALGHFVRADQPRFLANIRRALRPGGRFVFVTGESPSPLHPAFWAAHGFNAVMRVRNKLYRPQFVMYYLTFVLPEILGTLERAGFASQVDPLPHPKTSRFHIVTATRD